MKKDFSQPFEADPIIHYQLLVQHSVTKKFLLLESTNPVEEGWHRNFSVDIKRDQHLSLELAKFLYNKGLVLDSYRELARHTTVGFSFVNNEPGEEHGSVCLLVVVDVVADAKLAGEDEKPVFVSLNELLPKLAEGPFIPPILALGIAQLAVESRVIGKLLD